MNAVPIYEVKNKLPLFLHQAEDSGPVFISRRNKTVGVLLSFNTYNNLVAERNTGTILERAAKFREQISGNITDEEIDEIFNVRDNTSDSYTSNVYDGVFKDSC